MDGKSSSVVELFSNYNRRLCRYNNCFRWLRQAASRTEELLDIRDDEGELVHAQREL